jgi:P4 family phage/plasmid primase-like protien
MRPEERGGPHQPGGGGGGAGSSGATPSSAAQDTTLGLAAASYAARGWAVFPLRPGGKEPLTPHGFKDASTDPEAIAAWWRRWPGANIGVSLGEARLVALDIDDPALAEAVLAACPGLPQETWCQRTPRGGLHVVVAFEEGEPPRTRHLYDAQGRRLGELRSAGGYVLAWPSRTESGAYELLSPRLPWEDGAVKGFFTAEDAEAFLLGLLREAGVELREAAPRPPAFAAGRPLHEGDGRNTALYITGRRLLWEGVPPQVVAATLRELNASPDVIAQPLPPRELETVIEHVLTQPLPLPKGRAGAGVDSLPLEALERQVDDLPTDYAHGRIIAHALRGRACFVSSWGWVAWTGQRWQIDPEGDRVAAWAAEALRDHYIERARAAADPKEQAALLGQAAKCLARARVTPALAFARAWLRAEPQDFDQHPYLLNTPSGVLDLREEKLLPHDPSLRLTRMTTAPYDPDADCPTFRRFLSEIFAGNERLIAYVQRLLGHTLIAGNPERVFPIFWGLGGNGKSTLLEAVAYALGDYAQETPPETFLALDGDDVRPRNDLARLYAARLVTASEAKNRAKLDAAVVKRITGGDRIAARFLFREFFEFTPQFVPILRTNFKPRVAGDDQAAWDRLRLIPFTVRIPPERQDRRLLEKLKGEASGILKWLVQGCRIYLERGLEDPPEVLEATAKYRAEVDDIYRFLEERTERAPDASVQASVLYQAYKDWAQQEEAEPVGAKRFGEAMLNLGYERYEAGGKRYYRGLRLKEPPPPGDVEGVEGERQNPIFLPPNAGGPGNFSGKPSTPSTNNPRPAFEAEEPPHPPQPCPRCQPAGVPGYYTCERGEEVTLLRVGIDRGQHILRSRQAICFNFGLLRAIEPDFLVVSLTDGSWGWATLATARKLGHEGEFGAERQLAVPLGVFTWEAAQGEFPDTMGVSGQFPDRLSGHFPDTCEEFPDRSFRTRQGSFRTEFPDRWLEFPDTPREFPDTGRVSGHEFPDTLSFRTNRPSFRTP